METLDQYLAEQLKNPKFKKEWDELEDEYQIIENIVKARIEAQITRTQSLTSCQRHEQSFLMFSTRGSHSHFQFYLYLIA